MALLQGGFLTIEGSWGRLAFYRCLLRALPLAQPTSIYSSFERLFLCCVALSILAFLD
jgi:hypothetical protein